MKKGWIVNGVGLPLPGVGKTPPDSIGDRNAIHPSHPPNRDAIRLPESEPCLNFLNYLQLRDFT